MAADIFDGVQCALLDIDGTLVDSNEYHVSAWDAAFRQSGHTFTTDSIRNEIGKGADQLVPALLPKATAPEREKITHVHDDIFKSRYLDQVRPFEHASEFVVWLHGRGIKVVLASSAKRAELEHYVQLLNIKDALTASTCSDDVDRSKPAGDIFAAALESGHADSSVALAVGDTPYDVIAAAKCGVATAAVLSGGFSADRLLAAGARAVYASVGELLAAGRNANSGVHSQERARS
jgi:HAD superfamily hydrolase (TIGR01549 family)